MDGQRSGEMEALVDTGASYTVVPCGLLAELGVEPFGRRAAKLADGHRVTYDIGRAMATVDGHTETTLVLFGDDGTLPASGGLHAGGDGAGRRPGRRPVDSRHQLPPMRLNNLQ